MFCPKCGTQNLVNARFCRTCGIDVSLVPHAITGHLPVQPTPVPITLAKGEKPPNLEKGISGALLGLFFLALALAPSFKGNGFDWFWFIPASGLLAKGISNIFRWQANRQLNRPPQLVYLPPPGAPNIPIQVKRTNEFEPAPSITEQTTRHLNSPVEGK